MSVTSTIGNVYLFTGSLVSLQTGGLLDVSVLNSAGSANSATFVDDDGRLTQADDGDATVSINGAAPVAIDYLGAGSVSTATLLGIPLLAKPMMAFQADGAIYLHFPDGLPPLSGLLISFNLDAGAAFALPNPMPICLTHDTRVRTSRGDVDAGLLRCGDIVLTQDHGPQPIRWIGRRAVGLAEQRVEPRLRPVRIAAGALGDGIPLRDMLVTQHHRILLQTGRHTETLVAAKHLVGRPGIVLDAATTPRTYIHLLFDRHEIIVTDGCATESLYLGTQAVQALPAAARAEIGLLFPAALAGAPAPPARPILPRQAAMKLPAATGPPI